MKKRLNMEKYMNFIGIFLMIGFVIRLAADYYKYQITINSAPFYAFIITRSLEFLLPGVICFIISAYLKKHNCS